MVLAGLQQSPPDPFFTNDGVGVLKLLSFGLFILVPLLAVVYRLSFNKTNDDLVQVRSDVNGLGQRVSSAEHAQSGCQGQVATLANELARYEGAVAGVQRDHGALAASVDAMRKQSAELQHDILQTIIEGNRQVNESIMSVRLEVAKIQTAQDVAETIGGKIADALRK